eukprot:scaffold3240_cov187-Amphora_coffeaeformis.AAC.3
MMLLLETFQATALATVVSLLTTTPMELEPSVVGNPISAQPQAPLVTITVIPPQLRPCAKDTNCVSSYYAEPPNRYVSPWLSRQSPNVAFQRALRDLSQYSSQGAAAVRSIDTLDGSYIHAVVLGTAPNSFDDIELFFKANDDDDSSENVRGDDTGTLINLRCEARVTLPPPPFCIRKNCINGSMDQRDRLARIQTVLGLPAADASRMQDQAKWTPIFFNSDKVPSWDDDDDDD